MPDDGHRIPIQSDEDIVKARRMGRALATELGFSLTDLVLITTAISELARNIVLYAKDGEITLQELNSNGRRGIKVEATDHGPGIADIGQALESGFSTSGHLGLGLPGVRRLMDDVEIRSTVGTGTTVVARKWHN